MSQPEGVDWKTVTPGERRWVLVFAGVVLLLTSLPYLIGYATQGEAYRFTGFVFAIDDGNSYIAKMQTGTFGNWLFRSSFSAMPQRGVWLNTFYILVGKLAAPPGLHEQLVALYHLCRLAGGLLYILATYDFLAFFLKEVRWRRLGVALGSLGGGLGWLLVLLGQQNWFGSLPLDFYSPEAFGFLHLYGLPHLALARAGMLWTLLTYLKLSQGLAWDRRAVLRLGLFWLLTGLGQPLTMAITGLLIAVHLLSLAVAGWLSRQGKFFDWKAWWRLALEVGAAGLLPAVMVVYTLWVSRTDPYVKGWTAQNLILAPHPLHYGLAYGLVLPYALVGALRRLRRPVPGGVVDRTIWLPVAWVLLLPFLAYAPLVLQRRLTEGVWTAWIVLALAALDGRTRPAGLPGDDKTSPTRLSWPAALPLLLAFPTTLFLLLGGLLAAAHPALPSFRPENEVRLFDVMREDILQSRTPPWAVVLASFDTSNALAAWAPVRVVIGLGPETVGLEALKPQVQAFFSTATPDEQRREFIRRSGIRYVIWGPAERQLGDWSPETAAYLVLRAQSEDYSLFEVTPIP